MAIQINFDSNNMPIEPSFILAKRNGTTIGMITNIGAIDIGDNINIPTIDFKVSKSDGINECAVWDDLIDFKLIYCIEWDTWFEITVTLSDGNEVVKSVSAKQLEQSELSQINLYGIEINTETDIERDDYEPSVLYNPSDTSASILHRILADKATHYTILHVDDSIKDIQRTFSFDGANIKSALDEIAEEINAVVIYGERKNNDRVPQRTISLYDLSNICQDCGYRSDGSFDVCPECGSTDITHGYGNDTTIYVSKDNLTDEIEYSLDSDSVKSCFKLTAGDDLMTATIANFNPNGSSYIWRFSDEMISDMPDELVTKLNEYNDLYDEYSNTRQYTIQNSIVSSYNSLIEKYDNDNYSERAISSPIVGYQALTNALYNVIDFQLYVTKSKMPTREITDTSAEEQVALLTSESLSPISPANYISATSTTINSYVLNMAKLIIDQRYKVEIYSSYYNEDSHTWTGNFVVTNYSDEEDTATSNAVIISIVDDYTTYVDQKVKLLINKKSVDEYDLSDILAKDVNYEGSGVYSGDLIDELRKYNLAVVTYIRDCCQTIMDVLAEASAGDSSLSSSLYDELYDPYFTKLSAIEYEIYIRDSENVIINTLISIIDSTRNDVQTALNLQDYLGNNLWNVLCSYRREDEYTNDNYISDGLTNAELIEKANDFLTVAKRELLKSSTYQHRISSTLKNLLAIKEFENIVDYFQLWNWIRIDVNGEIYKLRLVGYNINFNDLENISVEFSDVIKGGTIVSDSQSIFNKLSSVATTYNAVAKQASKGTEAKTQVDSWKSDGVYASVVPIISGSDNAITQDEHGMLFRAYDNVEEYYDDTQLKIINSTLAITDDNWKTVKAAIGKFRYNDPETNTQKSAYGINGETIIGNLILGESLGIYNSSSSLRFNQNGLVVTNEVNTVTINPNADSVFTVSNEDGNVISFDAEGNGIFSGDLYAEYGKIGGYYIEKYNLYTQFLTQEEQWSKELVYDDDGNVVYVTELAYDSSGNPIYETDEDGNIIYENEIQYDSSGNIIYEIIILTSPLDLYQDIIGDTKLALYIELDSKDNVSGTKSPTNPIELEPITSVTIYKSQKELVRSNTFINGYLNSSGNYISDSNCIVSEDYIPVDVGTYITGSTKDTDFKYIVCAYDSNYNFISSQSKTSWTNSSASFSITSASYIKLSFKMTDGSAFEDYDDIYCADSTLDTIEISLSTNVYSGALSLYDWYSWGPGNLQAWTEIDYIEGGFAARSDGAFQLSVPASTYDNIAYSSMYDVVSIDTASEAKASNPKKLCVLRPDENATTTLIIIYDTDFSSVTTFNQLLASTPMQVQYIESEIYNSDFEFTNTLMTEGDNTFWSNVGNLYIHYCGYAYEKSVATDSEGNTIYDDDGNVKYNYDKIPVTKQVPIQATQVVPLYEDVVTIIDTYYDNYASLSSNGDIALSIGATSTIVDSAGNTVPDPTSAKIKLYNRGEIYSNNHTISAGTGEPSLNLERTRSSGSVTTSSIYSVDNDTPAIGFKFKATDSSNYNYSLTINKNGLFPYIDNTLDIGSINYRYRNIYTNNLIVTSSTTLGNTLYMNDDASRKRNVLQLFNDGTNNYGSSLVLDAGGNTFIGSGESAKNLYNTAYKNGTNEKLLLSSDEDIQFLVNCQNIAQRKTIVLDSSLNFRPITNATGNLGSSSYRWDNIYSAHAVSVSSDERIKKDLQQIYKAKELIMGIIPYQFKFTYKDADRIHYGFSSQQFKQVLDDVGIENCGAWTLDVNTQGKQKGHTRETATEDEKIYGLRYEELIAPIVQVLQEFEKRLCNIEEKLNIK